MCPPEYLENVPFNFECNFFGSTYYVYGAQQQDFGQTCFGLNVVYFDNLLRPQFYPNLYLIFQFLYEIQFVGFELKIRRLYAQFLWLDILQIISNHLSSEKLTSLQNTNFANLTRFVCDCKFYHFKELKFFKDFSFFVCVSFSGLRKLTRVERKLKMKLKQILNILLKI